MAQSAKLQLRQSQGLALTPQLMQSIKLLQMSAVELGSFVQGEIDKNPLLELNTSTNEFPEERRSQVGDNADLPKQESPRTRALDERSNDAERGISETRFENPGKSTNNPASNASSGPLQSNSSEYSAGSSNLEAYVASQQSLREFLLQQAAFTFRSQNELRLAHDLIDLIDPDGYLRGEYSGLCKQHKVDMATITGVLGKIQKFDPPGVGARNLGECMRLQLMEKNRLDPAMRIFTDNLELLARRDYEKLAHLCQVDHEDLIDMAREIQELEPRPGDVFDPAPVQNVIPDVYVSTKNDGSWLIELNTQMLPRVLINREYYSEIKDLGLKKADKKYMVDNLQNANWLVASLDQRARTILKVATEIVKQQDMFFVKGKEFLKPLTLKTVAENIDLHESTVSRVTRNKYLTCNIGIFEFKYFFMSGIKGKNGDASVGSQSIRTKIRNLIQAETENSVLSDENIASALSADGIDIARRTVTKYRESIGILSSIQRRRELKAVAKL